MHCAAVGGIFYHKGKNQILSRKPQRTPYREQKMCLIISLLTLWFLLAHLKSKAILGYLSTARLAWDTWEQRGLGYDQLRATGGVSTAICRCLVSKLRPGTDKASNLQKPNTMLCNTQIRGWKKLHFFCMRGLFLGSPSYI